MIVTDFFEIHSSFNYQYITRNYLWNKISYYIAPNSIVIAETGTTELGVFNTDSPKGVTFISQIIWGSIGYTVSASMADSRRIVYLFVGDGPFQLTAREISVYIRHGLTPVVFLLNNAGYLIEKLIHEPRRSYNNYQMWEYNKAFGFFGDHLEQNQANCKQPS
ncbi:thiamine diphosphate-binding protein [Thamnidium elegans]|nr:thiamine diphosphate-binding protein [Thamnidium elegans]